MACINVKTQVLNTKVEASCSRIGKGVAVTASLVCSTDSWDFVWLKSNDFLQLHTSDGYMIVTPLTNNQ